MAVTLVCAQCGNPFLVPPSWEHKRRFCSAECRQVWRVGQQLTCPQCGKLFYRPPFHQKSGGGTCCSRECAGLYKRIPLTDRFWAKVDKNGPVIREELGQCWIFTGDHDENGYGRILVSTTPRQYVYTHRLSFAIAHGKEVGDCAHVLHRCDYPPCCRPEHLFEGNQQMNNQDRDAKDRVRHGSAHANAKLNELQVAAIRRAHQAGGVSVRGISELYGVSHQTISDLLSGRTWKRVHD